MRDHHSLLKGRLGDPSKLDNYRVITFGIEDIDRVMNSFKFGKAEGADGISAEHLRYAHPSIAVHLSNLFNLILLHGYVPNDFGCGIIIPC